MVPVFALALAPLCASIIAPNTSFATVPTAYFGGNQARRGNANIKMLSKMRIVMIEKWEGVCSKMLIALLGF